MIQPQQPFKFDFNPYSLPPGVVQAIGLVSAISAQTENVLEQIGAGCLGIDFEYGMAVTSHMSMPQRFSLIRSAAEIRIDDLDALDELDDLLDRAEKAFEARNGIVHHEWCVEPATRHVFRLEKTARKRVESDVVHVTDAEIQKVALELYEVGMVIYEFATRLNLLPAIPPHPRPRYHKSRAQRKKRREALLRSKKPPTGT